MAPKESSCRTNHICLQWACFATLPLRCSPGTIWSACFPSLTCPLCRLWATGHVPHWDGEPQLLAVGLFRSNTSQVLTGHHLVGMLPQSDLPTLSPLGDRSCSSLGWRTSSLATSLMCVPLDAMKQDSRPPGPSFGPPAVSQVTSIAGSSLVAAAATALPSPALFERLTPDQRVSFLRVWARLPSHLRAVAFDLHGSEWTLSCHRTAG